MNDYLSSLGSPAQPVIPSDSSIILVDSRYRDSESHFNSPSDFIANLNTEVKARIAKLKLAQHAHLISGFVDTTEEEDEDTCRITFKTTVGNAKKLIALG